MAPSKPISLGDAEAVYLNKVTDELTAICDHYEKTAPTVHAWADRLYRRVLSEPWNVGLSELLLVRKFREGEESPTIHFSDRWLQPNYAANMVYKCMYRLGQDTTGHAGF